LDADYTRKWVNIACRFTTEIKARVKRAEVKAHDPEETTKSKENANRFDALVCSLFEQFLTDGLDKKKAVAATN
jgi:hypothetical protein